MRDTFSLAVGLILILLLMGIAGAMDVEDAEKQEQFYCERVATGHWPDYRQNYRQICRGKAPHAPDTGRLERGRQIKTAGVLAPTAHLLGGRLLLRRASVEEGAVAEQIEPDGGSEVIHSG